MIKLGLAASDLAALGITNQRATTVVWNRKTGRPYFNAIVPGHRRLTLMRLVNVLIRARSMRPSDGRVCPGHSNNLKGLGFTQAP